MTVYISIIYTLAILNKIFKVKVDDIKNNKDICQEYILFNQN